MSKAGLIFLISLLMSFSSFAITQRSEYIGTTYITEIAWSPDGIYLAIAGANPGTQAAPNQLSDDARGYLRVINVLNGSTIFFTQPASAFTSVAWSPDGQRLALGSFDGTVWIVNAVTGERVANLFGHQSTVTDVDWKNDGTQLVSSGNWDQLIILWDAMNYTLMTQHMLKAFPQSVAFSVDGSSIAVGTQGGLFLLSSGPDIPPSGQPVLENWIHQVAYNSDGRYIAVGTFTNRSIITGIRDITSVFVIDAFTGSILAHLEADLGTVGGLSWSPDSQSLAILSEDNLVNLWHIESETIYASYPVSGIDLYDRGGVAYSSCGGRLALSHVPYSVQSQWPADLLPSEGQEFLADGAVQLIVPAPSLDRLNAIAALCVRDGNTGLSSVQALAQPAASIADLPAYIARVEALPADAIPPACRADLLAVAGALLAGE